MTFRNIFLDPKAVEYLKSLEINDTDSYLQTLVGLFIENEKAHRVMMEVQGSGDSGDYFDLTVQDKDGSDIKIPTQKDSEISEFLYDIATSAAPGFEINDGGGCHIDFELQDTGLISMHLEAWYNEMVQQVQSEFKTS